ncbi:MAG: 3-hydroxyacyl-CoA dehydrogenase/enoyl-CoA hydratase family protein [Chloroflexi bacterium]|nr:MAG: 3-hydroxyacyl-CoA dehydrogenase/enoyl-CoA hydratase family protein [Chloroflexota bacterium]
MEYAINRVAVIGAGTMGAAIAAHLANAGIPAYLLDIVPRELTAKEEKKGLKLDDPAVRNRIVNEGWQRCVKARPANLFAKDIAERVTLGNLEDNFDWLGEVDWIIEVIVERLDIKQQLMARLEEIRKPNCIVTTNTSGIPIKDIAAGRSDEFKAHFLGTHFFNPPRYLKLLEIIPHEQTAPEIVEFMKEFGARTLGKGVVVCKDTPNFIANRFISVVGAYTLNYALDNGYTVEEVDALTGPTVGHPKTATFRLYDLVGIDVMAHVNTNLYPAIANDPYREELVHEKSTALITAMVEHKWLGNKTKQGFYKRVQTEEGRQFWVLNPETMEHQPPTKVRFESVGKHRKVESTGERIKLLCAEDDRAAKFIWATTAFGLNYAASIIPEVADDILSIDNANKWGFMHEMGPFEIWDALGVAESVERMEADGMEVTPWVKEMLAAGYATFYEKKNGKLYYYDPASKGYAAVADDPRAFAIKEVKEDEQRVIASNPSATLLDMGDGVLGLEFHSKMNALDTDIFKMMERAREELDKDWVGLVIGNQGKNFCVGANIFVVAVAAQQGEWDQLNAVVKQGQDALMGFRYSPKPVVSAPFGMALGGGAEVTMGASAVCAASELYIGQVEAGVGLVPAAGGCKELVRRVISPVVRNTPSADPLPFMQQIFERIAMAKVSASAVEAQQWGFLAPSDRIVMNSDHLLHEAKQMVLEMAAAGYRPPVRGKEIWAMGANGLAALEIMVWSLKEAGYASEHDALVASKTAYILCGGKLTKPQWVAPQYILDLEREAFLSLLGEQKTLDRIWHMLNTGKPLRN